MEIPLPIKSNNKQRKGNKELNTEVSLLDLITLYVNLYQAAQDPKIGYHDIEQPIKYLNRRLEKYSYFIKHKELEKLLYACQQMDEQGKFWNISPGQPLKTFVNKLLNYKQTRLYFNQIYSWIYRKPRGRPKGVKK